MSNSRDGSGPDHTHAIACHLHHIVCPYGWDLMARGWPVVGTPVGTAAPRPWGGGWVKGPPQRSPCGPSGQGWWAGTGAPAPSELLPIVRSRATQATLALGRMFKAVVDIDTVGRARRGRVLWAGGRLGRSHRLLLLLLLHQSWVDIRPCRGTDTEDHGQESGVLDAGRRRLLWPKKEVPEIES